jgi:MFS family permease
MPGEHDPYAALRSPSYRFLLVGGVLASIGGEIQAVAVGWELYDRTSDAAVLGYTGLAQFLPVLLLALPVGHAVDRYSRKLMFQGAQILMAASSVALALLSYHRGPIPLVFVCLVASGISRSLGMPSRSALLAFVVPAEHLPNAVAWNSTGWQVANVTGPALGGLAIGITGQAMEAYLLTALCCLTCATLVFFIHPRVAERLSEPRSLETLLAGVRFVWRTQLLLAAITLDLFAVLLGGATTLLPIFAKDILDVGPTGLGWLRAAPAAGAFVMALLMAHRPPLRRPGRTLLLAVAGFGAATIVFGLSRNFTLSFAMLLLTGAFDNISVVVRGTMMQMLTPDDMRGRVAAVNSVFISSSNELGGFESGMTADWFGPVASVVGGGVGTIVVVLVILRNWPQLWGLGPFRSVTIVPTTDEVVAEPRARTEPLDG